ncbi:hypothetical protein [Coraliomargarita parva]|uniref:hypothetical protein n=1 Tax=Coraliomargarita parva TaxID=3014050 RepID=UPI0022B32F34|nr:hypothetical protein [Coraliomargarita parva]
MKPELKAALSACSPQERSEASVYLKMLERVQDPSYHREMRDRAQAVREGRQVLSSQEIQQIDQALSEGGL